jgi:hypothetical protein
MEHYKYFLYYLDIIYMKYDKISCMFHRTIQVLIYHQEKT